MSRRCGLDLLFGLNYPPALFLLYFPIATCQLCWIQFFRDDFYLVIPLNSLVQFFELAVNYQPFLAPIFFYWFVLIPATVFFFYDIIILYNDSLVGITKFGQKSKSKILKIELHSWVICDCFANASKFTSVFFYIV